MLAKIDSSVLGTVVEVTTISGSVPEKTTLLSEERCSLITGSKSIYFKYEKKEFNSSKIINEMIILN